VYKCVFSYDVEAELAQHYEQEHEDLIKIGLSLKRSDRSDSPTSSTG